MKKILLLMGACTLGACTVTDEDTQTLDVDVPKFTITVNGTIAYSTLSQAWGPITCDDGSEPVFTFTPGAGVPPGITVPIQENSGVPIWPVEVNLIAGDPSGIEEIQVFVPPGPIVTTAVTNSLAIHTELLQTYSAPLVSSEDLTYRYSRTDTDRIRHRFEITDGAANSNEAVFLMDIAPESEVCP